MSFGNPSVAPGWNFGWDDGAQRGFGVVAGARVLRVSCAFWSIWSEGRKGSLAFLIFRAGFPTGHLENPFWNGFL